MKKVFLFIAVIAAFSFASCKKDRACTCNSLSNSPGSVQTTSVETYTKARKKDARVACESYSYVETPSSYVTTVTCTLN